MDSIFDVKIDRSNLSTMKWEYEFDRTKDPEILSFGTAEMDFKSPQPILDAVTKVVQSGHLGYPYIRESYYDSIENWLRETTGWKIDARKSTATNVGIYTAVWTIFDALTAPGDEIIIQTPVHFCFKQMIIDNNRVPVLNPLCRKGEGYTMDFEQLESLFTPKTKLFWLCNPHNPVGRAWSAEELTRIGELCLKHNVLILSDDVYCGLIFPGHKYTPIAALSPEFSQNTITCYSPSKSYNTTGVKFSFVVSENSELLGKYNLSLQKLDLTYGKNLFGLAVTEAAYRDCGGWLSSLMEYIRENHRLVSSQFAENLPKAHVAAADSTYFAWVDLNRLNIPTENLGVFFEKNAHILVGDGAELGKGGEGCIRINIACPRSVLLEGLKRIIDVYRDY